jgi:hypothetical protein
VVWRAVGITLLVAVMLPWWLIKFCSAPYTIDSKKYRLSSLFLDKETDTYSLSRLQFYVWTVASVFAYVYLALACHLVQGNWILPGIPPNLTTMYFISAATGVSAVAITDARGAKGAGPIYPSLADFISTGGWS